MAAEPALRRNVRRDRRDGHVVAVDLYKRAVNTRCGRVIEVIVVKIVAPRRLSLVIGPGQHRESRREALYIIGACSAHGTELALADKTQAEIRKKRQVIGAEES